MSKMGTRTTLKRQEFFSIATIVQAHVEEVPGGLAYKLGIDDEKIAALVNEKMGTTFDSAIIKRVRGQALGKMVTDKSSIKEQIVGLKLELAALRKQVIEQGKLIAALQGQLPQLQRSQHPRIVNGHQIEQPR